MQFTARDSLLSHSTRLDLLQVATLIISLTNIDLRNKDIGLFSFKSGLIHYYKHALSNTFDMDDPSTWKSVCIKCKGAKAKGGYHLLLAVL